MSSEALDALREAQRADDQRLLELYARRCGLDLLAAEGTAAGKQQQTIDGLQTRVDAWEAEHGDAYEGGIQPKFDARKARRFDSYWNWAVQDLVETFSILVASKPSDATRDEDEDEDQLVRFQTRATPRLLDAVNYLSSFLSTMSDAAAPGKVVAGEWLGRVRAACREACADADGDVPPPSSLSTVSPRPCLCSILTTEATLASARCRATSPRRLSSSCPMMRTSAATATSGP